MHNSCNITIIYIFLQRNKKNYIFISYIFRFGLPYLKKTLCFCVCSVKLDYLAHCPSLYPRQFLWLRSCCHLLSVLLTLRNGTCPSHRNLSLLQSWHWGGTLVTLDTSFSLSLSLLLSLSLTPLSPPTRHLVPRWSRCRRRKLSLCALPFTEKNAAGQREGEITKKHQWTPSAVICVQ